MKKIIIILTGILIVLFTIFFIVNFFRNNETGENPVENVEPTGIVIPTESITAGKLDVVAIDPQDDTQNIALDRTIEITFSRTFTQKEIEFLGKAINNPQKPFMVILGGAKVSDKIMLIENLLSKADAFIIGGGMAYTFLKALGVKIGNSLLEADKIDTAKNIFEKAKKAKVEIALSKDYVIVKDFKNPKERKVVEGDIPDGWSGVDIGPKTREEFKKLLSKAKTIIWNGPVGVFEIDEYAEGTKDLAKFISSLKGVTSIVGGGDTAAAVAKFHCEEGITHISTGGGASLEFLEGKVLPGIAALNDELRSKEMAKI